MSNCKALPSDAPPPEPVTDQLAALAARQIETLSQTYPAWQIRRVVRSDGAPGGWWATRYASLTPGQRAAGLVPSIARRDVLTLMMELAVQDEIAHQGGYSAGATPPAGPA